MARAGIIKNVSDDRILEGVKSSASMRDLIKFLGLEDNTRNRSNVRDSIRRLCPDHKDVLEKIAKQGRKVERKKRSRIWTEFTDQEFTRLAKNSNSISAFLRNFGSECAGGTYRIVMKRIQVLNIDVTHFVDRGFDKTGVIPLEDIIKHGKHPLYQTNFLKERLYRAGLKEERCEECGITEWNGKELVFHLDHIDGNKKNHLLDNLKILCPNCHSQTPTFAGRNVRLKRLEAEASKKVQKDI